MGVAHIETRAKIVDGVMATLKHAGQKQAYGDSFYEYDVTSDLPAADVERVCAEKVYTAIPESQWRDDCRANPGSMEKAFRAHYKFEPRGDGKYFYQVRCLYTD